MLKSNDDSCKNFRIRAKDPVLFGRKTRLGYEFLLVDHVFDSVSYRGSSFVMVSTGESNDSNSCNSSSRFRGLRSGVVSILVGVESVMVAMASNSYVVLGRKEARLPLRHVEAGMILN
jgi:hypothetical protein